MDSSNQPIYVTYVGIGNLTDKEDIEGIMKQAYKSINPVLTNQKGEMIFIPIRGDNSRIECINPVYITNDDLIRENRLKMDELHEHLDAHLKTLLNNKKESGDE